MKYVPCLRVAMFDIKALTNLEVERRMEISPLLNMRGKDDKYLRDFLGSWVESKFFLDVSRSPQDSTSEFIKNNDLHNPDNAFLNKRKFYDEIKELNQNMIPVVSWSEFDERRQVIQLALRLAEKYPAIAVRISCEINPAPETWQRLKSILDAVPDLSVVTIIMDYGVSSPSSTAHGSQLHTALRELNAYNLFGIVLLSTSFPIEKPDSNTYRTVTCFDLIWQEKAKALEFSKNLIFGDYAATSPESAITFIPGMIILPFANYFSPLEWWQIRKGGNNEYQRYIEIASEIRQLPGYHGDDFCWANREIARISKTGKNYGNNGVWNGYKINQHICAMLAYLNSTLESKDPDEEYLF